MKSLHISQIYNRKSIQKNGLIPSKIRYESHKEALKQYSIDDKILYTWADSCQNEKFIKDMIYSIAYIHPRDNLINDDWNNPTDFRKYRNFNLVPYDQMIFDIYLIDSDPVYNAIHIQQGSSNYIYSTYDMDDKYSHDDKPLMFYNTPQKARIIGQAEYYFSNKHNIKILR